VSGGQLRFRAPDAALTEEIRAQIRERRAALIELLAAENPDQPHQPDQPHLAHQPLSEGQAALWFLHQLDPRSTAYNTLYAAHLAAEADTGALRLALDAVHARHELLRGRFGAADGRPFVSVETASTAPLEIVDAAGWTREEIDRFIAARADEPFDLERGPIARWHLLTGVAHAGRPGAILALVAHHIVVDFRSLEVLLRDVTDAYLSITARGPQPPPDVPGRFRDYVRRQQQWIRSERGLEAQSWWKTQLAAPLPVLDLPTDFSRPATQDYSGATLVAQLDADLAARVKQFAKDHLVTPNSVLLGAFSLLLSRYARQNELLIGVPMLGRTGAAEQDVVGYFVNPVVLRLTANALADAVAHVQAVHRASLDAMTHQAYPFARLVDDLNLARDGSRSPLFQVAFVYERESGVPLEERGLFAEVVSGGQRGAVFDLTLTALERAGAFRLTWEYATALFRSSTIERMSSQFAQLVGELVSRPRDEVRLLSVLSNDDAARLARWNGAGGEAAVDASLADRFAAQVARTPDALAVETPSLRWTYAELDARANEIAAHLLSLGVTVNVPVALALERGPEMIAAVVAVMKAGGACVPVDTSHPRERVRFMLQQSNVAVLIADAATAGRLPEHTSVLVRIEGIKPSQGRTLVPDCPAGPEDLLYVMYTSGSTGQPKGVAVPHRTLVNLLDWQLQQPGLDRPARTLQYAPLTFDASYHEIATALCSGGSLLPIDDESRRDSRLLVEWIARHRVERLFIPFVALQHLAEAAPDGLPACLGSIITAGEQLRITPAIVSSFGRCGTRLHNHYGPTESHVCTAWPLPERVTEWEALPPIGRPVANTQMHVLGPHGELQPIGVPGELWIGGAALALGYINRPDLTAERFIEHPRFGRIYKTGDVGRWRDDGALEYLGRTDHQVKLRGFRVELEEIEAVLSAHPTVLEAAVSLIGDGESKALAAFVGVGPHSSARDVREQILLHLRAHLPDYMVPARITVRERLPQTSSGKIDRGALAALPFDEAPDDPVQSGARTETERTLQAIWASLLGVERPGVHVSFFDLGGHSLRAARLVARIRTSLAVDVPLRAVFEDPTIHALARRIDAQRNSEVLPPLEPAPANAPLQLSFGQQRLWLLDQLEGPSATYSIPAALQLEGPLQIDALRRALATIVARHAGLRLVFPAVAGQPQVRVIEPYDPLAVTDLSALAPEARRIEAERLQRQHAAQPFDLARGPLLRAHVLRLAEGSHLLLFGMHHIISDGWSLGVLLDELRAFYEANLLGGAADVRALPVQYPDYAAWQRQWLRGEVLDRQLAYWTRQLAGAPPLLELPADYPRPAQQRYRGGIHRQQVSGAIVQRLRRFNVTHESTAFMTLLSVFQLLLSQHSGQDEVCVGTPVANRRLDATEGLIGFFVNTLVMRARIDPAANFDALLAAVRATSLDAFTHQDLPFELLVDALQPQRSLSHSPLFQAMFVMVDAAAQRLGLKDVDERLLPASLAAAKFDLTLYVEERGDEAELIWEYDADLFAPERIARMAGHFAELLGGVLAAPEAALATLPMLTPPEQLQISAWGRGPSVERKWPSVMAAVAAQVQRAPDRIALACGQARVTYRELNARANRIARALQAEGIGRGQVVAICLPRGVDMVASVLGALKAGAAYLPLDPAYPPARLGFILEDAGAAMVISDSSIASVTGARPARACWIDRDAARLAAFSGEDLPEAPAADDVIYVIYTSGSTGQPKGAAVRHGGFANLVQWYIDELNLCDDDRVLLISALGFDLTQKNLFAPLVAGGTLCIPESETYDPAALRAEIEAQQITWVNCTPSAFYPLVDRHDAPVWRSLATLRWVVLGGEPIDVSRLRPWLTAAAGRARVLNSYGPTECTDICLVWAFDGQSPDEVIPLGRPIPNMRLAVLDSAGRPVPVGLPGELWIGGAGVGAGYLHRPELNAAAFRDVTVFGETWRMYRSGDRVRWRPDGVLDYLGRGDHQIKLRGFRIELGEIENALRSVPGVSEAVAVVRERDGQAALVAYVVAAETATPAAILQQAASALPAYMVPSQVVRLARMPLTPHGKVDRLGLPDPDEQQAASPVDVPVTATETQLARTWGELLGVTAVGRHADFFASGGHSLLATRLVARIADEFGVELPLRALFEHPTLSGVAAAIDERQAPLLPAIGPRPSDEPPVLSFAQERLWFLDQLEPGSTAYSIPAALDLRGELDIPALTRALGDLVARHDVLRLRIVSQGGTPSPRHLPPFDPLTREDVSAASDPLAEAEHVGREHAGRPFDLESGPLFRAHLVTLGPARHRLLFNLHHVISDGWSVDLLIRDLAALYSGHRQGTAPNLPALPLRYTDYSRWQREQVSARAVEQLAYWRKQLGDAPDRLELPVDFPRTGLGQHQGGEVHLSIDPALTARLEALARAEGSTLFMGLLAAFSVLLYRASAQKDICIGTPVAYRPSLELEHVAGLFLNTLVVRTRIAAGASFLDVLAEVRKSALGAYANQDVPFEYLVEQLQPQRSLNRTPLFQVMLNLVNTRTEAPRLDGMEVSPVSDSLGLLAKFDLSLSFTVLDDGGLDGRLEYNAGLFARESIAFLADCFQALLRQVVEQPDRRLAETSMLEASTRARFAAVSAPAPAGPEVDFGSIERSIPARFAEQVRARPDAIAVCTPATQITYSELDQRARRVAAALMAGSIGRAVALLLPHDAAMAVGVMGTLQSGRIYVPLDASHPIERLLQIAADAEISAVVSCAALNPLARRIAGPTCPVIDVDSPGAEAAEQLPAVSPDSIAYVLYTSGSTGTPKGVIQNHRNVLHFIREYTERLRIQSRDRVLQVASYAFDAAVMDLYGALLNGATLYPVDLKQQTVREAVDWIADQAITIYHSTPTVFRLLCEGLRPSTSLRAGREVPAVRLVVLGGEAATRSDFETFQQRFGAGCLFVNGLGPTESTVTLQMFLSRDARLVRDSVPVGYPVANTGILLVDADDEPTELCGEIVVRSPHVALGYWQRDSSAFSDDPQHPGQRLYRTGDLARLLPDGSLEALGRRDGQIKLRGFRIELGEIESALRRHPAVTAAAVVLWPALEDDLPAGAERILAAYVSGDAAPNELKAWLRDSLPDYMVPAAIAIVDRLPMTPNGKLDRRSLPALAVDPAGEGAELETDSERALAELWSDVLVRPVTDRAASFFDLGGHSLVAARLVARIRERLGVEAPLRLVFEQPVLHEQAAAIERYRTGPVRPPIEHRPLAPVTLTAAQQRLWFLAEREGAALGAAYTISAALAVDGALDETALRRALIALTARHDGLRINVRNLNGSPDVTLRDPYDPLQVVTVGETATDDALARMALAHASAPFDLAMEPLLRLTLVRDPDESPRALLFSIHHLIADGWSLSVLVQELSALYAGDPLAPLPITMADYAAWERQWLTGPERSRQLAYWRTQLADAPALLELPTDLPRPAVKTYRGAQIPVQLPADLVTKLRAVGQSEGATLAMTVQAGLVALLHRYSGANDIVVGSPVAQRPQRETEGLIGLLVNTVALRTKVSGAESFAALVRRVRQVALDAYGHADVPFDQLVEELQPARSLSYSPVYQVMCAVQTMPVTAVTLGDAVTRTLAVDRGTAKVDLLLSVGEENGALAGVWEYRTDLWEADTIARLAGHFETLLAGAVADPQTPVAQLPMLTPADATALGEWNATATPYPRDVGIHTLVASQADARPDAVALVAGAETVTYRELVTRARQLAGWLQAHGVEHETPVGVCLDRSVDLIVSLLAILEAGGAYVPLDPGYPQERLAHLIGDTGLSIVLAGTTTSASLPPLARVTVLCLDTAAGEIAAASAPRPTAVNGASLAYVMYTSGSTGQPKGVAVPHRAIARLVLAQNYVAMTPADVVLHHSSIAFDASTFEVWAPLLTGGRLVLCEEPRPSLAHLQHLIETHGVTTLWLTSGLFTLAVDHGLEALRGLRYLLAGGDVLSVPHVQRAIAALAHGIVINGYGPTENTTFSCCAPIAHAGLIHDTVPIGRPIANTHAHVLDDHRQLVPIGLPGELYLGGDGLARGYWGDAALTQARFVDVAGLGRLYRTGDRVRWRADGQLEFLGRVDTQVKLRGFRIEPGEIEAVLRREPGVRDAVVLVAGEGDHRRLVAYVAGPSSVDAAVLRGRLQQQLPAFMVPTQFVVLDELPLNANGKIDRSRLPAPPAPSARTGDRPLTPIEEVLAGLWSEVLQTEVREADADFFALGGHSLMAMQVVARIRATFAVEVPLATVFSATSLAAQGEAIAAASQSRRLPPITHQPGTPLTLTAAQQRLWFLTEREGAALGSTYTIHAALGVEGAIDQPALRQALVALTARHDSLRVNVKNVGGSPEVTLREPYDPLIVTTLTAAESADVSAALAAYARIHGTAPFNLATDPLLRLTLIEDATGAARGLVFSIHHLIADGWSLSVLVRELAALYAGDLLPPLPVTMADYAVWERQWLAGPERTRQLDYWRTQLADAPALLEMPTDGPRPAVKGYAGAQVPVQLAPELVARLRAVGQAEGATLAMTVLAGLMALLHRYSGATDVVVGSPVAQRPQGETEGLIGLLVNTVALRAPVTGAESFAELVRTVRRVALEAYGHVDLPFDQLLDELQLRRSLSYSPVYQVMCAVQTAPAAPVALGTARTRSLNVDPGTAKVDLLLNVADEAGALVGVWEYRTDLWSRETIARLAEHFDTLLSGAAAAPDTPVAQLPLVTAGEAGALAQWSGSQTRYPRDAGIPALVAAQAALRPTAIAAVDSTEALSYAELVDRARQLAGWLQAHGVGPETPVGVCLDRSVAMVVSLLGILEAGGAYVPLDPAYPAERLAHLMDDTGLSIVLTTTAVAASLPGVPGVKVLCLDAAGDELAAAPPPVPMATTGASLAYLMYTSGSTGQPKGVAVPHRAIARLVLAQNYVALTQDDVVLHHSSIAFDASTFEVWGPLLTGGRLVLCETRHPSLAELAALIETHGVTTLWLTSGLFALAVDHALDALRGLRFLLAGGDVLSVPHVRRAVAALSRGTVINGYGPTENTTFSCCAPITDAALIHDTVPIGRPIANTTAYVLGGAQQPVPVGVPGELYVGGDGLARGYWRDPALTQERFVTIPGLGRLYRTGDRCRWRADGQLEFLGRLDAQVKLRGFRVEPGEIEAVLRREPNVRDAVVLLVGEMEHRRIVAYAVGDAAVLDGQALRTGLLRQLPAFMVPAQVVVLDQLPLTANGKVDRARLPVPPEVATAAAGREWTATELALASIWTDVLRSAPRDANADFFGCGGNSLLAMQLVARVRAEFQVDVPIALIFETPGLGEIAAAIAASGGPGEVDAIPRLGPDADRPLSFAQERLWFLAQLEPDNPFYNSPLAIRIQGALDRDALAGALQDIVDRHDVLRTAFVADGGRPRQVVRDVAPFVLMHERIGPEPKSPSPQAARTSIDSLIHERARREAAKPFDLANPPLLRAVLLALDPGQHVLLLTMHHIVTDGWSLGVMTRELAHFYRVRRGEASSLAPLAVQYADFAAWQRRRLAGERYAEHLGYWRDKLAGAPPTLSLPADRVRPAVQQFRGGSIRFTIDDATREGLHRVARERNATLFMTLLGAFATLLYRHSGQHDIVVGSPIANRQHQDLEQLLGFFVNTLALRVDLSGSPRFVDLLDRIQRLTLEGYAHQDLPFEKLVDELQPERDLSRSPLFQVMFALQNAPMDAVNVSGLQFSSVQIERRAALFDLVLDMWETPGGLTGVLEYNRDLFDHATAERMIRHLQTLIASLVADATTAIDSAVIVDAAEQRELLALSNGPRHEYPVDRSYAAAFEEQVASAPDREAAVDEHERVTYGELNARANRVAHALKARGIGPGIPVAVFLPRGIEYLAAVLGVVKAGGVFVPVDVSYPAERVRHMLEDSGCPVVLSDAPRSVLLERLNSATSAAIVLTNALDGDDRNPPVANGPRDALYMIYTSGSTGLPKGALVRHDGALNHIYAEFRLLDFTERSAFLQSAPASSDISVWQCLAPLLAGGRTVLANFDVMVSPPALLALIQRERVTLIELVPAVLDALVGHAASLPVDAGALPDLRHVMVTGEAAPVTLVNRCHAMWPRVPIVNAYGPTEAADDVCQGVVAAPLDASCTTVPIGVPLDNMSVMVLDAQRQLAPIGVPGEIAVSGIGVGAGYWRQPERTAAAFVPNLHAGRTFGDTIYRTGDLGRWRHDGSLEFIGRVDQQVKIRGFRVELGEIEAVIAQHAAVRAAVVIDVEREPGDRQIVAYIQPESDAGTASNLMQEQVAGWKGLHDESYADDRVLAIRPAFNTIGWDSTYTGEPLTDREMRECVANAVTRIRRLKPSRLLEIGCGTGLLLYRLAGRGFDYCGTDLSETAIRQLDERRRQHPSHGLEQARLVCCTADDFSGFTPGEFDAVALNSVVQYFPSAGYLQEVLRGAARVCDGRGAIFVGDVRSLPLLRSYYASVQVAKAAGSVTASRLAAAINEHIAREQELLIAPRFFDEAARQLSNASPRLQPKRGWVHNELTRFRYDVTLPLGDVNDATTSPADCWTDWRAEAWSLAEIGRYLAEVRPEYWGLRHVANARLRDERGMLEWLAQAPPGATVTELREWLSATSARRRDVDPESIWQLAKHLPYRVDVVVEPGGEAGEFAVLFSHRDSVPVSATLAPDEGPGAEWQPLTSNPLQEKLGRRVIPELREHLRGTLPGHMIPQSIVVLDRFPLLPNGKVDRGSLPVPASDADRRTEHVAPRTPTEAVVHAVWSEVLGVPDPGAHDNFFALGGHSLKASQVISRLQQRGKQASLRDVFNHPTLAELATAIDRQQGVDPAQQIARTPLAADYPTSAAQRRLWVLAQIGGSAAYNMADAIRLRGRLDADALARAFDGLLRRHESLRTSFVERDGELRQVVSDQAPAALAIVNLEAEPDPMATARVRAMAHAGALHDLSKAPLLSAELLRLSGSDHVLLVNMHHIVSDGWSMDVLIRDVMTLYDAAVRSASDPLLPLPIQHRDYVAWQEERLRERRDTDLRYWVERLRGAAPLDLPTDAPRPVEKTFAGARRQHRIPRRMAEQLAAFAKAEGVTPSMLLTSLVKVLLHRHSGQSDISVGCPVAGRPHPQLEAQVGFFVNTLVLRDQVEGAMPFVEFLAQVRETVTGALAHQDVPFDWVVNELKPARDASRNPLFDVMVAVQNTANESLRLAQVEASSLGLDYGVAQFDLLWSFTDTSDGLFLDLRYNADLFAAETIDAIVEQWQTLAAGALAQPSTPVARLPLIGAAERARLTAIPDSFREEAVTGNLADAFDAQALRTPDAIALRDGDRSLTYAELQRWVTYAAGGIRRQLDAAGRGQGTLVGICLHRSVEQVVAILATLKAGAGYVPLDPDAPAARLAFIRQDAGVPFVVTHGRTAGLTGGDELALPPPPRAGAESWRATAIAASNPAYVIYTSGSTGEPKGVVVSHANVLRLFTSTSHWFAFGAGDVWTLFHSYAFDFSVWEIWGALLHGGRLVIVPYAVSRDPEECYRLLSREQVTVLNQTPSAFRQLLHSEAAQRNELPLALRYVIFGGEALHPSELTPWFERHGDRAPQLVNMYGITETTVHVTYRPLTAADASRAFSPIGEPIPDLYLQVLDPHQEPSPVGVPGELYVGGAGLANGYWQRDPLTSQRFVPDPFHAGRRLYRTGDRVRTRRTGELEYLGRVDTQVKIRGHRVELGEIASVIARHPGVREAVVVARRVAEQTAPLAYYVPAGAPVDAQELRRHAQQALAEYMVPLAFTAVDAIPLTVNGKLDEAALPSPVTAPAAKRDGRAPRTEAERRIVEVWREALGQDALGPDDNVFDHGAHSVLAVLVRRRLEAALGREIPVVSLFQYPTPAALALHLDPVAAPPPDADAAIDRAAARRQARRQTLRPGQRQ
jgi:amino acid adenylation domain-containing protein